MILVINCGSSKTYKFKEIAQKLGFSAEIQKKDNLPNIIFERYSKIIISGGPTLLTQDKEYYKDFAFVKTYSKPILGVCLGHQIIGLQFGAKIYSYKPVSKDVEIDVLKRNDIFKGLSEKPIFREDHREYIDLPEDFLLLAKSNTCINEAMKHKIKPIYGLQFHPEISNENGLIVLKNFFNL